MLTYCAQPGCRTKVAKGRCAKHRARNRTDQRYSTAAWTRYSRAYRAEHPFCSCGRLADVVDHIVPVREAPERFWDETNHQSLCRDCNQAKEKLRP